MSEPGETLVTISQILNIGIDLKRELELAARRECRDATSLGRELIREGLAARQSSKADKPSRYYGERCES